MSNLRERAKRGLKGLIDEGKRLIGELNEQEASEFTWNYQTWYTKALSIVKQLLPDRLKEFTVLYSDEKTSFDIAGYLISHDEYAFVQARERFIQQYRILESAQARFNDVFTNLQGLLQLRYLTVNLMHLVNYGRQDMSARREQSLALFLKGI